MVIGNSLALHEYVFNNIGYKFQKQKLRLNLQLYWEVKILRQILIFSLKFTSELSTLCSRRCWRKVSLEHTINLRLVDSFRFGTKGQPTTTRAFCTVVQGY